MNIQKAIAKIHLSIGFLFNLFPGEGQAYSCLWAPRLMVPIYPVLKESGILFKGTSTEN